MQYHELSAILGAKPWHALMPLNKAKADTHQRTCMTMLLPEIQRFSQVELSKKDLGWIKRKAETH